MYKEVIIFIIDSLSDLGNSDDEEDGDDMDN